MGRRLRLIVGTLMLVAVLAVVAVLGLASIARDVTPELARAAIASVTMPAGLVIEMTHARGASSAMRRAIASTTGTARYA